MDSLFKRCAHNPLLGAKDLPFEAHGVFNAGAADLGSQVVLLLRIEDMDGRSHLRAAFSDDGIQNWHIAGEPLLHPSDGYAYEAWGVEDCRINVIGNEPFFLLTYTAYSEYGPSLALAKTEDFKTVERMGIIFPAPNKNGVIFPRKFEDQYVLLHRPGISDFSHIWSAYSYDLKYWGNIRPFLPARGGAFWDGSKIGPGIPPLWTNAGWLLIYHGVKQTVNGYVYRAGTALLDSENPHSVIGRTKGALLAPEAPCERSGDVPNVIFPCGGFIRGDECWVYYGAADTCVCLARAKTDAILRAVSK